MISRFDANGWWVPAATACVALAALGTGSRLVQAIAYVAIALCMIPIAINAVRHRRLDLPLAAGLSLLGVLAGGAAVLREIGARHDASTDVALWAEVAGLSAGLILIAVVGAIARNRRGRNARSLSVDAGIVAVGCWLVSWIAIIRPTLDRLGSDHALTIVRIEFQPVGAIVLFFLVVIVFSDRQLTPAVVLGAGAVLLALAGGVVWDPLESTCRHASLSIL